MIIRESMESYLARPAMSSSMAWDITSECPAYAYARSPFYTGRLIERETTDKMDFGTIAHLAVLEPDEFDDRIEAVSASAWRTKAAKELRAAALAAGKLPLLATDYDRVMDLREALQQSEAAPYLFGEGESEVTFTWEIFDAWTVLEVATRMVPCKARIDRLAKDGAQGLDHGKHTLVHLKTSESANPLSFSQVAGRLGYDLTAAWYRDGWRAQEECTFADDDVFIVVSAKPPHLVSIIDLDPADIEGGRTLYHRALAEFCAAQETGVWRGYGKKPGRQTVRLPAWYRRNMFDLEGTSR